MSITAQTQADILRGICGNNSVNFPEDEALRAAEELIGCGLARWSKTGKATSKLVPTPAGERAAELLELASP